MQISKVCGNNYCKNNPNGMGEDVLFCLRKILKEAIGNAVERQMFN